MIDALFNEYPRAELPTNFWSRAKVVLTELMHPRSALQQQLMVCDETFAVLSRDLFAYKKEYALAFVDEKRLRRQLDIAEYQALRVQRDDSGELVGELKASFQAQQKRLKALKSLLRETQHKLYEVSKKREQLLREEKR